MNKKSARRAYPLEIKLEAIRLFYQEGLTRRQIEERLGLPDTERVKNWLKMYRREGRYGLEKPRRGRPLKQEDTTAYIKRLEMENVLLKKYHTELRKGELAQCNIGLSITTEKSTK